MNKAAIKKYAVDARKKWIQAIAQQAAFYGCTENGCLSDEDMTKQLADKGIFLEAKEKDARRSLVNEIKEKGYQNAIEEIAYTWFNRLIAIRFMEVNSYLPSGIRVLSSVDSGRIEPDCVREYARLDFINQDTANGLAAESDERLYRYILVEQCNVLGKIMPKMFTHIGGIAALLLPERLYIKEGLVYDLTHTINEKDFGKQVEIIGWLYQYYISEKKDEVFAALKKNVKITRENIPAATQLFTPKWIVKYMVENSLGRLWLERHPNSSLRESWKYYLDEAEQTPEVMAQLRNLVEQSPINKPEEIRLIDPCMGSGHILVYAFDVLFRIYHSVGYSERDIPDLILEHNIYGLDIDERACQLAYFALMMKARSYNRRFFRREDVPQPQVYSPQGYDEGMEYGSLVKVDELDGKPVEKEVSTLFDMPYEVELNTWNFRRLLHQKYDVVVTNPPYMGSSGMSATLAEYVRKNYPVSKSDMFAVFIEKCGEMLNANGYQAMITQHAWMFLSSYEKLRAKLMRRSIINMVHLGARAFEEIGGEVVQTATFVMSKCFFADFEATYVRLVDFNNQQAKEDAFLSGNYRFYSNQKNFEMIPGEPISYWISNKVFNLFHHSAELEVYISIKQGVATSDNDRFLRLWYEVETHKSGFGLSRNDAISSEYKWFPYNKGGTARKWYGNNDHVVNYWHNGKEMKDFHDVLNKTNPGGRLKNQEYYFREGFTWSAISSQGITVRYCTQGFIFDTKGSMGFSNNTFPLEYFISLLNSAACRKILEVLAPTLDFNPIALRRIPVIILNEDTVCASANHAIAISRSDWDSFETSWDFQTHPLIAARSNWKGAQPFLYEDDLAEDTVVTEWSKNSAPIAQAFDAWEREADQRFATLKANEEELNRIFIDIYGLQDELTPEVEDKDITVRRADLGREIRSFVSYAVGCMFGRYSIYSDGLFYAGGPGGDFGSMVEKIQDILHAQGKSRLPEHEFYPEDDNILPITDADYFDDDIVMRFIDFVKVVYGEDTLAENLEFIANALYSNGKGTARERIRRYFQNDFFKDHCKIYQKRPIYWLFDSGKQNGFKALIYLHRYDKYTVARVRTEYLHPLQRKYEAEIERMKNLADLPETSPREKAEFKKQIEKISKQIAECRTYDQIISHMASQTIELDLDDGVKVNYNKFQGIEIPRDDGKGYITMNLLGKIS